MKESIEIKKLGPIDHISIPEISKFTVLVGKSAAGKSAVMKALAMMRYIFKRENIKSYLKHSNIKKTPLRTNAKNINKLGSLVSPDTEIIYKVAINSSEYSLQFKENHIRMTPSKIKKEDLVFFKGAYISELRSMIPYMLGRLSNKSVKLDFYGDETVNDFDNATEDMDTTDLGFLKLRLKVKKSPARGKIMYIEKNGKHLVNLQEASSGIKNSAPVETVVKYFASEKFSFKDAFNRSVLNYLLDSESLDSFRPVKDLIDLHKYIHVHLEEPELSLDPKSQIGLLEDLVKIIFCNDLYDRDFNMIIATHSPYIVNHLNVLMERSLQNQKSDVAAINPEYLAVYKIEDGTSESLIVNDDSIGDNRKVVDTFWFADPMSEIYDEYENLIDTLNQTSESGTDVDE